jgi:hypothetical protein
VQREEQRFPHVTDQQEPYILPIDGLLHLQKPERHPEAMIEILKLSHAYGNLNNTKQGSK